MRKVVTAAVFAFLVCINCGNDESNHAHDVAANDTLALLIPFDSIGISFGDSSYMLGSIWAASYTADGNIAILDKSLGGVRFYSADGEHIEDFIPQGEGPGEFQSIDRMCFSSNGNFILASYYDRKAVLFNPDLELLREIVFTTGRNGPVKAAAGYDSSFVLMNYVLENDSVGTEIALFRDAQEPDVVYRKRMIQYDTSLNYQQLTGMIFATSDDGKVYIANRDTENYLITCYSPEGDSLFTFGDEDFEPINKPDSLIEHQRAMALEQYVNYYGSAEGFDYEPNPRFFPITSIGVDSNGRIWIRGELDTDQANIFSSDGTYLYTVVGSFHNNQVADGYNFRVNTLGILVDLRNPEEYPVVYQVNEVLEIVPR